MIKTLCIFIFILSTASLMSGKIDDYLDRTKALGGMLGKNSYNRSWKSFWSTEFYKKQ